MAKKLYNQLCRNIVDADRGYDTDLIKQAYKLAAKAHEGQFRISGEPYIIHPVCVAMILVDLGMDTESVCAALLHDVVEDTPITLDEIRAKFSDSIAVLVNGLTKLEKVPLSTKEEQQAENIRKMLLAMSQDIRVIIIKLADRLHNMRTLEVVREQKRREIALETMEIYAPIANRLGIMGVKEELEDISLRYLDPVACDEINNTLAYKNDGRNLFIETIKARIMHRLSEYSIVPHIEGRTKSLYGIYRKVYVAGKSFDEIYDIYAVRIIANTDIECYNILGIIHDLFTPIPNRFKDYISTPKPNMYQSLHTTVIGKEGVPFEIQIRTWAMHYTAEYGIAAHWKYKEGIVGKDKLEDRLAWIRQIIEAQQDADGAEDIVKTIKTDLTPEEIYAFTPKGDVKSLPADSTVIDFAYAIHSEVGHKMIGAKVDGKMVSLDHKVKTGQIIEILTTKSISHGPNKEWLSMAKTSEARSKIRAWFKKERREENIIEGKLELDKELKRNYIHLSAEQYSHLIDTLCKRYNFEDDDLFAAIGYGGVILSKIMPKIKDDYVKMVREENEGGVLVEPEIKRATKYAGDIIVDGIDNCLIKFSQCCNPLPGDEVIGFITRGHGVSIHKMDCVNVINSVNDPEQLNRWISVHWNSEVAKSYNCTLDIVARDHQTLFADVCLALSNLHIPIHEISARQLKNGNAIIVVTIALEGIEHLKNIMFKVGKIPGVISVERSGK